MRVRALLITATAAMLPLLFALPAQTASNKLPNPSFEASAFGSAPDAGGAGGVWQPLLPSGWAFEGSAGLFDHADERGSGGLRSAHGGYRFAAISIPASGKPRVCSGVDPSLPNQCAELEPVVDAEDEASLAYSVNPAWRNAEPVSVTGRSSYTLRFWAGWELVSPGAGIFAKVRWLDVSGVPIAMSNGPSKLATPITSASLPWTKFEKTVTAPSGAASAVVLLGHTDDVFIGQVRFDDVFFG